eukprot:354659-Chlamydomonas_euryale.AAC.1
MDLHPKWFLTSRQLFDHAQPLRLLGPGVPCAPGTQCIMQTIRAVRQAAGTAEAATALGIGGSFAPLL